MKPHLLGGVRALNAHVVSAPNHCLLLILDGDDVSFGQHAVLVLVKQNEPDDVPLSIVEDEARHVFLVHRLDVALATMDELGSRCHCLKQCLWWLIGQRQHRNEAEGDQHDGPSEPAEHRVLTQTNYLHGISPVNG